MGMANVAAEPAAVAASVLHTPRRGRRVGVDLWDSPVRPAPHTFPRLEKRHAAVTPRKRRADAADASAPSLVDDGGWASAGLPGSSRKAEKAPAPPASPSPDPSEFFLADALRSTGPLGPLALFRPVGESEQGASSGSSLVAVDVGGRGRLIVHPNVAARIRSSSDADTAALLRSHDVAFSGGSGSSATESSASTSATSLDTPCAGGLGPSPSFSLASHFPASESGSPSPSPKKLPRVSGAVPRAALRDGHADLFGLRSSGTTPASSRLTTSEHTPRLGLGLGPGIDARLPTLDWPDDPKGPWAAAGEHVVKERSARHDGIARWLATSEEDAAPAGLSAGTSLAADASLRHQHQHPMIAKALRDRARRDAVPRTYSMPDMRALMPEVSPRKRSRRAAGAAKLARADSKTRRRLERKLASAAAAKADLDAAVQQQTAPEPAPVPLVTPRNLSARNAGIAQIPLQSVIGCVCGHNEEFSPMVQCDVCNRWYHIFCLGITSTAELDDEWFCDGCCERALSDLTPGSFTSGSVGFTPLDGFSSASVTPFDGTFDSQLYGLSQESQHQQPVFAHPTESPAQARSARYFDGLALAPSPHVARSAHSGNLGDLGPSLSASLSLPQDLGSMARPAATARARASRIGRHQNEPGSPLERKSATRPQAPARAGSPTRRTRIPTQALDDPFATPVLLSRRSDWQSHGNLDAHAAKPQGSVERRTPSPRLPSSTFVTPSRTLRSGRSDASLAGTASRQTSNARGHGGLFLEEESSFAMRDPDDPFSTPSRLPSGASPWGHQRTHTGSLQTPSRMRETSASGWGLGTPSSSFLAAAFGHDSAGNDAGGFSVGMPSLVFSSGGVEAQPGDTAGTASSFHSNPNWALGSPTSSTRAATRARDSSDIPSTPELVPRRSRNPSSSTNLGSLRRSARRSSGVHGGPATSTYGDDEPPSSSPFPRTPTFDEQLGAGARHVSLRGTPTSAKRRSGHQATELVPGSLDRAHVPLGKGHAPAAAQSDAAQQQAKLRTASGDLGLGLGIGLDSEFDDVLNWT